MQKLGKWRVAKEKIDKDILQKEVFCFNKLK